jgi:hypothetical protein
MTALMQTIALALAAALLMAGGVSALAAASFAKRVAGVMIAFVATMLALAVLGAPPAASAAAAAIAFAYVALGVALLVRIQEAYATAESVEVDAADDRDEPAEPAA